MNHDRNKYLTEAMGECWHDDNHGILFRCKNCRIVVESDSFINFSIWPAFGKLWEWAQKQEWWKQLQIFCEYGVVFNNIQEQHSLFPINQINPNRFANAVYEFLKSKESEES